MLPCGDTTQYLGEAVASCLAQTRPPARVLVIDDATTADGHDAIRRVADLDPRVEVVANTGTGLVDALNTGVDLVETPFIARMDADDICLRRRFELQENVLLGDPTVVAVGGLVRYMDENGALLPNIPWVKQGFPVTALQALRSSAYSNPVFHPTAMMRTNALKAVGGYRNRFTHIEDYELWTRLLSMGDIVNVPKDVLHYRRHASQVGEVHGGAQAQMVEQLRADLTDPALARRPAPYIRIERGYVLSGDLKPADAIGLVRELARCAARPVAVLVASSTPLSDDDKRSIRLAASIGGLAYVTVVEQDALRTGIREWAASLPGAAAVVQVNVEQAGFGAPRPLARRLVHATPTTREVLTEAERGGWVARIGAAFGRQQALALPVVVTDALSLAASH